MNADLVVINMSVLSDRTLIEMDGLYHCTTLKALTSILKSRAFHPFFCLEEASYLKDSIRFAFAVVCFADLRRSELKEHMRNFSSREVCFYLEREWRYLPLVMDGEAYYMEESDFLNESLRRVKQQELVDHKYVLGFIWDDILEVGGSFKHSVALINILSKLFSVSKLEAASKVKWIY